MRQQLAAMNAARANNRRVSLPGSDPARAARLVEQMENGARGGEPGHRTRGERPAPYVARRDRPAPLPSRQYARAQSTQADRDGRLTDRAKTVLRMLYAWAGRGGVVQLTCNYVAATLHCCRRTILRALDLLEDHGYLQRRPVTRGNLIAGLEIRLSPALLPCYEIARAVSYGGSAGVTSVSPTEGPSIERARFSRALWIGRWGQRRKRTPS